MDQWREVLGFAGYQVSDSGRVMGPRGRILKPSVHRDGYLHVKMAVGDGTSRNRFVHILVARAFCVRFSDAQDEVDHLDDVKTHNAATNLEWVTHQENMQRAADRGRINRPDNTGERNGQAKLDDAKVLAIRAAVGATQVELATRFGVSRRAVGMILRRERWVHV